MKTKILFLVLVPFLLANVINAQSDYEKTQNFKKQLKQIEESIKSAVSLDECNVINENISKLKNEFKNDSALLDKTLYPDNFESCFSRVEKAVELRKGDFSQIVDLKSEVGELKTQITEISDENKNLIGQIKQLNLKASKDAATISSLQKLVAQLKANIQQRDLLVRDIVDSLLSEFIKTPSTLNDAEKTAIIAKIDSKNLFYNIQRTIADNVQFMKVTQMLPNDLSEMKKQYRDFNKVWKQIGPKLSDVYLNRKEKAQEIANIDAMFSEWNARVTEEMWAQINKLFRDKQISILPFRSGDQFVNSIKSFVDDEIKNRGVKSSGESEKVFTAFADSVYYQTIEPTWVPILVENNMMTEANKDSIDASLARWKAVAAPSGGFNWVYVALGAVIVILIIALFFKGKKKQPISTPSEDSIKE